MLTVLIPDRGFAVGQSADVTINGELCTPIARSAHATARRRSLRHHAAISEDGMTSFSLARWPWWRRLRNRYT